jgi:hypothetical protein
MENNGNIGDSLCSRNTSVAYKNLISICIVALYDKKSKKSGRKVAKMLF